ncbi:Pilus assembly protein, PilP [Andreprevotia lacus DSM 23236]|jgi:Tfp pilus assembly protein PilP|uniref:Pilus assembly protein, PilP n=1 Tax=Andreprevotia lacus DSM 23236 TaxID=1121001 RepID=A0A1W1XZY2_9NEIS|nr:pilus assembly protein PilP [Andreprevotia lacus]SMC29473.1 Pilus assembly protein, PilP [Andreprevotia lacus DSM 23236]
MHKLIAPHLPWHSSQRWIVALALLATLLTGEAAATREKQALEAYELADLRIVTIQMHGKRAPYAVMRDPAGYLHWLFPGDYLGRHYGLVKAISAKGIRVLEVYELTTDNWQEVPVWLPYPQH